MDKEWFRRVAEAFETVRVAGPAELGRLDPELRPEVERLMRQHESTGALDETPVPSLAEMLEEKHPESVGPYRIVKPIGEGGMGVVYLAEQEQPIRRKVALKLVRGGMATRELVARFESERQALALMSHPSIARIYDAGLNDDGRPWFAMEYVDGAPLTDYCDRRRLGTAERLRLFGLVCDAVQHAHQKGILHRDLKPSNILVTEQEGEPAVKVIDFGVARAIEPAPQAPLMTRAGALVGTPMFMSPEQARGDAIDTRSDIYSLGVVLYVLLAGVPPADEPVEDPPLPSTRVQRLGADSTSHAEARGLPDGVALARRLRGDLDWIAMKALEHDPARRYASVNGLAADIGRHLRDEPVAARPPSASYRAAKFVRRHRTGVAAAAVLLVSLVAGLVASLLLFLDAEEARRQSERRRRDVQLLADVRLVGELAARADELWPAHPRLAPGYEEWIASANDLLGRLPGYERELAALAPHAERTLPALDAADAELRLLDRERTAKLRLLARHEPNTAIELSKPPVTTYFRHEFVAAENQREGELDLRVHPCDGAVVYLNGTEVGRINLPAGPIAFDTPAQGPPPPWAVPFRPDAALLHAGRNALAVEVHVRGPDAGRIQLCADLRDAKGRPLVAFDAPWRYDASGEDRGRSWLEPSFDTADWPEGDAPLGWYAEGARSANLERYRRQLVQGLDDVARRRREAESRRVAAAIPRREFADRAREIRHERLRAVVEGMRRIAADGGLLEEVRARLASARALEDVDLAAWERAGIPPQTGLVPLGPDPESGLQEFAVSGTGSVPRRGEDGALLCADDAAIVLVLLPAGRFRMGYEGPGRFRLERPVHDMALDAFFLSKFEMTQAQWIRVAGERRSMFHPGHEIGGYRHSLRHPVESVGWDEARRVLARVGLELPTEAQWEYAARGGTTTRWWTGDDSETLRKSGVNLADQSVIRANAPWKNIAWKELDDGFMHHAPVGTFPANPFGIHDVHGNVREWTLDYYGGYEGSVRPGTGERIEFFDVKLRIARGGCYNGRLEKSTCSHRQPLPADSALPEIGIRPARALD